MTFDPLTLNLAPLQEGNIADLLDVEFEAEFPLTAVSEVICRIKQQGEQRAYLTKKLSTGDITISGQILTIPLAEEDSAGHAGSFTYECDLLNLEGKSFATIKGTGSFVAEIK
jgi:hypothetical protein